MSQASDTSVAAAMGGMHVARSDSELARDADELLRDAPEANASTNVGGLAASMESEEPAMHNDATGKCASSNGSSDHDDLFNYEDEAGEEDQYAGAVQQIMDFGKASGYDVKRIAAKHFVENKELFEEHEKTITDCARDDGSKKIFKQDVQNMIDILTAPPDVATQDSMFGTQDEDEEEEESEADDDLQQYNQAKLVSMLGEINGTIQLIQEKMAKDPVKMALRDYFEKYKKTDRKEHAKALATEMVAFMKTNGFATMPSEKINLLIDCLTAIQGNQQLPSELEAAKSEQVRIEEVLKQKALEDVMGKVEAKTAKTVAASSSAPLDKKRGTQASANSTKRPRK